MNSSGTRDAGIIGVDYMVTFGSELYGVSALIKKFVGADMFDKVGQARVTYYDDGLRVVVPLSIIGGGSGLMNYKVIAQTYLGFPAFTQILDDAPDVGTPPAISVLRKSEPSMLLVW
jgi:hypothetical protein